MGDYHGGLDFGFWFLGLGFGQIAWVQASGAVGGLVGCRVGFGFRV